VLITFASFLKEVLMPTVISAPAIVQAAGNTPKRIEELIGGDNLRTAAAMSSE
jgi:hypothetical protein